MYRFARDHVIFATFIRSRHNDPTWMPTLMGSNYAWQKSLLSGQRQRHSGAAGRRDYCRRVTWKGCAG